jgi:Fe-S-cluster containining protein
MQCREGCGACCIAASISSPIPGMPDGKPAGVRCIHLTPALRCGIFTSPDRPAVCAALMPEPEMCGRDRDEALATLAAWELATKPPGPSSAP